MSLSGGTATDHLEKRYLQDGSGSIISNERAGIFIRKWKFFKQCFYLYQTNFTVAFTPGCAKS